MDFPFLTSEPDNAGPVSVLCEQTFPFTPCALAR